MSNKIRRKCIWSLKGQRRVPSPALFVSAHIDSVFSADTDVTVTEKEGRYYGPGISDDARGLAALLSIVRAFNAYWNQTRS